MNTIINQSQNLIKIHQVGSSRLVGWKSSVAELDWHTWDQKSSTLAAFAKAIWLGIPAPQAVETVENMCRQFNPEVEEKTIWDAWFKTVRQLNGQEDDDEMDVA